MERRPSPKLKAASWIALLAGSYASAADTNVTERVGGLRAQGSANYLRFDEVNCYKDHGGVDIEGLWNAKSVEDCASICDATEGCSCFVLGRGDLKGKCWMRSSCSIDQCDRGDTRFATFLGGAADVTGYTLHEETNCWNGHGGEDLPLHSFDTTPASCAMACNEDSNCHCFVMGFGEFNGQCWTRKSCTLEQCEHGDPRFAAYTKDGGSIDPTEPTEPTAPTLFGGYTLYANTNCFQAHGAIDLPGFWFGKSASECAAVCDADPQCDCFVHDESGLGANCWKRHGCDINSCESNAGWAGFSPWDTYTKGAQSVITTTTTNEAHWTRHKDTNCYDGHGGSELPGMWEGQDVDGCAAICDEDPECYCFVLGVGEQEGRCWKRAYCLFWECEEGGAMFDTYVWEYYYWNYYYEVSARANSSAFPQVVNETAASRLRGTGRREGSGAQR